jgi:hypothetical protein
VSRASFVHFSHGAQFNTAARLQLSNVVVPIVTFHIPIANVGGSETRALLLLLLYQKNRWSKLLLGPRYLSFPPNIRLPPPPASSLPFGVNIFCLQSTHCRPFCFSLYPRPSLLLQKMTTRYDASLETRKKNAKKNVKNKRISLPPPPEKKKRQIKPTTNLKKNPPNEQLVPLSSFRPLFLSHLRTPRRDDHFCCFVLPVYICIYIYIPI